MSAETAYLKALDAVAVALFDAAQAAKALGRMDEANELAIASDRAAMRAWGFQQEIQESRKFEVVR